MPAFEAISEGEEQTVDFGRRLAAVLRVGDVVCLDGELGTGKTRLVEGIARGLGYAGPVTSPTFTLVHEYESNPPLAHVDAYRLADGDEFLSLGISELWETGIVAVEWADRVADVLPRRRLTVRGESVGVDARRWSIAWSRPREGDTTSLESTLRD